VSQSKLLGIIASLVTAIAIGAFGWVWSTNIEVKLLRAEIVQMKSDRREDQQQDAHIHSLWRYGAFLHEQIDLLRFKEGLPPATKPNLE